MSRENWIRTRVVSGTSVSSCVGVLKSTSGGIAAAGSGAASATAVSCCGFVSVRSVTSM